MAQRLYYNAGNDSTDVIVVLKNSRRFMTTNSGCRILHSYYDVVTIRIPVKNIPPVVKDSNTIFADLVKTPKEELTTGYLDLAVNKINKAHARFPAINGNGILASIKEQRLDTTDIDYTGRYVNTNASAPAFTSHASVMATTLVGAGNSSPLARGAAPAALVTSTSFASLLPESDAYYQQFKIAIQNHSYGTLAENYYGAEAAAYDRSAATNPKLVHLFSAGNAGTASGTGPYAGIQGWGNLTGNFKTAKNVIVVGAIDSFYQVAPASSKGPAFDGRIKPDLVAFGEDGSSGAAALASGTVALLQQVYNNAKKTLPAAALIKAVLLNSTDAIDGKHLSYASGYGALNGYSAVKTIVENRFFEDAIQHGVLKKFELTVPQHAAQVKITLAWTDEPGPVNTAKALVNDLDAVLKNVATGESWQPWVLNAAASVDSITKEAVRKQDTVNNAEQITLDNPAAGRYVLEVQGRNITTATQAFAIAYQTDTLQYFEWTFPNREDPVFAGQTNVVRWQTTDPGKGTIEYTINGKAWKRLAANVNLPQGYFKWPVPDTLATARLRMLFTNRPAAVTDTFVISKAVTLKVGFACADSFLLFWNALPAPQYQLYNLSNRYLQPLARTSDTLVILKSAQQQTLYYSVAPVINGRQGLKSSTINYKGQGTACYFRSFYSQSQDKESATFAALLGTAYNIASLSFQKLQNNRYVTLQTITGPVTTAFTFTDSSLIQGGNRYRLQLTLRNGATLTSDEVSIFHFPDAAVFIYPNPVRSGRPVTILINNAGNLKLRIFNASGVFIRQLERAAIGNSLATVQLPAGVYFIHIIKDDGARSTQKLVVY